MSEPTRCYVDVEPSDPFPVILTTDYTMEVVLTLEETMDLITSLQVAITKVERARALATFSARGGVQ